MTCLLVRVHAELSFFVVLTFYYFSGTYLNSSLDKFKIYHIVKPKVKEKEEPVAKTRMEINNKLLFCFSEEASLQVRTKIVSPTKSATFATTP